MIYRGPALAEVNRAIRFRSVRQKIGILRDLIQHATLKPAEWGIHFLSDGKPKNEARESAMIGRCAMAQTHNVAEVIGTARLGGRPQPAMGDALLLSFAIRTLPEILDLAEYKLSALTDLDLRAECERRGMAIDETPWTSAIIPPPDGEDVLLEWGARPDISIAHYSESARLENPEIGGWLSGDIAAGSWLSNPRRWRSIPRPRSAEQVQV